MSNGSINSEHDTKLLPKTDENPVSTVGKKSCINNLKLILIGDSMVGKTTMLTTFLDGPSLKQHKATVGIGFRYGTLIVHEQANIKLDFWDTAGQERFSRLTELFYRNSDGIILVFDLSKHESLVNIEKTWLNCAYQTKLIGNKNESDNVPVVLIGNKLDDSEKRQITPTQIFDTIFRINTTYGCNLVNYFETSCVKSLNNNIENAFRNLVGLALARKIQISSKYSFNSNRIELMQEEKKSSCWC